MVATHGDIKEPSFLCIHKAGCIEDTLRDQRRNCHPGDWILFRSPLESSGLSHQSWSWQQVPHLSGHNPPRNLIRYQALDPLIVALIVTADKDQFIFLSQLFCVTLVKKSDLLDQVRSRADSFFFRWHQRYRKSG